MTILVTGAAGFIGSHLCDRLLEMGEDVVGLDSFDDFYPRERKERNLDGARGYQAFTLVEDDIRDSDALSRISSSVDTVIHLAARAGVRPSVEDPVLYADVNVTGTANLLAWADRREVATFIFGSSSSVYGNNTKVPFSEADRVDTPISPYAATKRSAELLCHAASVIGEMTMPCLRLFTVYGLPGSAPTSPSTSSREPSGTAVRSRCSGMGVPPVTTRTSMTSFLGSSAHSTGHAATHKASNSSISGPVGP